MRATEEVPPLLHGGPFKAFVHSINPIRLRDNLESVSARKAKDEA